MTERPSKLLLKRRRQPTRPPAPYHGPPLVEDSAASPLKSRGSASLLSVVSIVGDLLPFGERVGRGRVSLRRLRGIEEALRPPLPRSPLADARLQAPWHLEEIVHFCPGPSCRCGGSREGAVAYLSEILYWLFCLQMPAGVSFSRRGRGRGWLSTSIELHRFSGQRKSRRQRIFLLCSRCELAFLLHVAFPS